MKNKLKDFEINQIRLLVSSSRLNFLERGKIYLDFKEKFNVSDYDMSSFLDKDRSTISREIRLYKQAIKYKLDTNLLSKNVTTRILIRALELKSKDDYNNFIRFHKKYKNLGFSNLVSLLNKTLTVEQLEKRIKKRFEDKLNDLNKLKEDLKK